MHLGLKEASSISVYTMFNWLMVHVLAIFESDIQILHATARRSKAPARIPQSLVTCYGLNI